MGEESALLVVLAGRGTLPLATLHGEPLFLHAVRAAATLGPPDVLVDPEQRTVVDRMLRRAGVGARVFDVAGWAEWATGRPVLVHDPLCPLTPSGFLRELRDLGAACPGRAFAAYRPVTDTVKVAVLDRISGTIDRDGLVIVTSPVAVPAGLAPADPAALGDLSRLVARLRRRVDVELVRAPSLARRVADEASVQVLECVDEVAHRVHLEGAGVVSGARPPRAP